MCLGLLLTTRCTPGEIQPAEQSETLTALVNLLDIVVEDRIAHPQQIDNLYKMLPVGALEAIARRDEAAMTSP